MIAFSNEPGRDECSRVGREFREEACEPRGVGQLMGAVLARYGISANADSPRPRLPAVQQHQPGQFGGLLAVG